MLNADPWHFCHNQGVIFFLKDVYHGFPDFLNNSLPGFLIPSDVSKGLHLDLFPSQAHLDRETIDPPEILCCVLSLELACLGELFSFLGQIAELFHVSTAWIRRLLQRRRETGSIAPYRRGTRKPPKFSGPSLEKLRLDARPGAAAT